MRHDLPRGTVTFLFTDVEGSTKLLHELGAGAYAEALAEHRRMIREVCSAHGGVEVDTQGDAFFFAFPIAPAAIAAAEKMTEALAGGPIRVRVGLHTGTPHLTDEGYVGADVHRAARIAAAGHGGQVLVSASTAQLAEIELADLGEHRFKDLSAPERVYQLGEAEFPALKSLYRTNLPIPSTPFLGRERELAEVLRLLESTRLLTLTGPGGTGKTRLALQAAGMASDAYPDGVFWVPLASLRDPELVLKEASEALGALDGLPAHIADKHMLVLCDNFEQVIAAAPELAALLAVCPNVRVVVTSRELLRVQGEAEYRVPPLTPSEAVELFCARSRLDPDDTIGELCRRLDELPLAVELAAARTNAVSPKQILDRISNRLDLLEGGRDADPRQQTLRAAIDWSYELLSREEQELFARLSVFAGGCTLGAAEGVCEASLGTIMSLVDKSLVRLSDERYWMLETIREYAAERLAEAGAEGDLRRRHAMHYLELAEAAQLRDVDSSSEQRMELVIPEHDNLRAALAWAAETDLELALRLAVELEMFWTVRSPEEGVRWLSDLLARADGIPTELRAHALRVLGSAGNPAGQDTLAERAYEDSLRLFRELGNRRQVATLLLRLGYSALYRGALEEARRLAAESLDLHRANGNVRGESQALTLEGEMLYEEGRPEEGLELIARGAELAGQAGFGWWRARSLRTMVDCALELSRFEDARRWLAESLRHTQQLGDRRGTMFALARLARVEAETGQRERAGLIWGAIEAEERRTTHGNWYQVREDLAAPVLVT